MASTLPIMRAETSVGRRFWGSSRASRSLPVPRHLCYRDQSTRVRRDLNSKGGGGHGLPSVRTVRRRRRPAAIKNVSEVEHDTDPCARSYAPILSLRASPTLTPTHCCCLCGVGVFLRPRREGTSHHADSWDQAQTSRLRRACRGKISQVQIFPRRPIGVSSERGSLAIFRTLRTRSSGMPSFRPIPPASARGRSYGGYAGSCARPCSRPLSCASVSGYSPSLRRVMVSRVCRPRRRRVRRRFSISLAHPA